MFQDDLRMTEDEIAAEMMRDFKQAMLEQDLDVNVDAPVLSALFKIHARQESQTRNRMQAFVDKYVTSVGGDNGQ